MDQAPLSMGFSKQDYRSGSPFLPYGICPIQESNPGLLLYRQILCHWATMASSNQLKPWINTVWVRGNPCLSWDIGLFQSSDSETSAPLGSLWTHIGFQIGTFTISSPNSQVFVLRLTHQLLWVSSLPTAGLGTSWLWFLIINLFNKHMHTHAHTHTLLVLFPWRTWLTQHHWSHTFRCHQRSVPVWFYGLISMLTPVDADTHWSAHLSRSSFLSFSLGSQSFSHNFLQFAPLQFPFLYLIITLSCPLSPAQYLLPPISHCSSVLPSHLKLSVWIVFPLKSFFSPLNCCGWIPLCLFPPPQDPIITKSC